MNQISMLALQEARGKSEAKYRQTGTAGNARRSDLSLHQKRYLSKKPVDKIKARQRVLSVEAGRPSAHIISDIDGASQPSRYRPSRRGLNPKTNKRIHAYFAPSPAEESSYVDFGLILF